jgi:hypothetical protein
LFIDDAEEDEDDEEEAVVADERSYVPELLAFLVVGDVTNDGNVALLPRLGRLL